MPFEDQEFPLMGLLLKDPHFADDRDDLSTMLTRARTGSDDAKFEVADAMNYLASPQVSAGLVGLTPEIAETTKRNALAALEELAERGHAPAASRLAAEYLVGDSAPDLPRARKWLDAARDNGFDKRYLGFLEEHFAALNEAINASGAERELWDIRVQKIRTRARRDGPG